MHMEPKLQQMVASEIATIVHNTLIAYSQSCNFVGTRKYKVALPIEPMAVQMCLINKTAFQCKQKPKYPTQM